MSNASTDLLEREYQFDVPDLPGTEAWIRAQPSYARLRFVAEDAKSQSDSYLDTDDWAIHRGGFALRIRRAAAGGEVTLKELSGGSGGLQQRREITQRLDDFSEGGGPDGSVSRRVQLLTNGAPLRSLFQVETLRRNFLVQEGDATLAVLSLDDSKVLRDGVEAGRLARLEVEEAQEGGLEPVQPFIEALKAVRGLTPSNGSKFEAGLLAAGLSPDAALDFGYVGLSAEDSAARYGYALLRQHFAEFLRHEPGTRLGEDPEELHDMRVATRKLRATLSLFKAALPGRFAQLRDELKWIGGALGEVRDLDVYLEWLEKEREASSWQDGAALGPMLEDLRAARDVARERLLSAMRDERYVRLVEGMKGALIHESGGAPEADRPVRLYLQETLRKRYRRLRKAGSRLEPDSESVAYHEVRVLAKKLRYGVEAARALAPKRAARLVNATKAVQDILGEHQDCVVAIERLRAAADAKGATFPPATIFRMGELMEQRRWRMKELRRAWPRAYAEVRDCWRPFLRTLRGHADDQAEPAAEAEQPAAGPAPVQRPFWLWQRFFSKGPKAGRV